MAGRKVLVMRRPGEELPPVEIVAAEYQKVTNRAGAYADMCWGFYPHRLKNNMGFDMPEAQARKLIARVPALMIIENTPYEVMG